MPRQSKRQLMGAKDIIREGKVCGFSNKTSNCDNLGEVLKVSCTKGFRLLSNPRARRPLYAVFFTRS